MYQFQALQVNFRDCFKKAEKWLNFDSILVKFLKSSQKDKNSRKGLAKYGQRVLDKIRIRTIFKNRFPYFYGEMKYLLFYYVYIFPLSTIYTDQSYQYYPGGQLGIFWVGVCRPGLQIGTPL